MDIISVFAVVELVNIAVWVISNERSYDDRPDVIEDMVKLIDKFGDIPIVVFNSIF